MGNTFCEVNVSFSIQNNEKFFLFTKNKYNIYSAVIIISQ